VRVLPPNAPAVAVALCLLVVTSAAALATSRAIDRREDQLVDERARQAASLVSRRTNIYIEKQIATRGLFSAAADGIPTPREYDSFLRSQAITRRIPELQTLTFVQNVRASQRRSFLARLRRETAASGLAYATVGRIEPPGERDRYGVITYVYPVARNRSAVGADLLVDPVRRGAIDRARDSAAPTSPAPVRLVQQPEQLSVVLYLPIYAGPDQTPAPEDRERRFVGTIGTGVNLRDVTRGLVVESDDEVRLYDLGYADGRVLRRLIHSTRPDTGASRRSRDFSVTVAGRRWILTYGSDDALVGDLERAVPILIGGFGLIVSLLAGAVVATATSGRRQALADLEASRNELARSNEELERFAFLASHDLQQPLRTVSGFLELLNRQQGNRLDDRGREYVDMALRGTKQMSALITDLLTYSRVARDDRPLEPVALDEAWDAAVGQLQATIAEADADVSRGPLPVVDGDRSQMTQLFANLIANAVKYRREEETPIVRAHARAVNGAWEVAVDDNGMGIDPGDSERIFEMFRRLHSDDDIEGTGVGLALVKRIAERSGGEVRVQSTPGRGSRFVVSLPAKEDRRAR
jgi:signal transduction histidine kinase